MTIPDNKVTSGKLELVKLILEERAERDGNSCAQKFSSIQSYKDLKERMMDGVESKLGNDIKKFNDPNFLNDTQRLVIKKFKDKNNMTIDPTKLRAEEFNEILNSFIFHCQKAIEASFQ